MTSEATFLLTYPAYLSEVYKNIFLKIVLFNITYSSNSAGLLNPVNIFQQTHLEIICLNNWYPDKYAEGVTTTINGGIVTQFVHAK